LPKNKDEETSQRKNESEKCRRYVISTIKPAPPKEVVRTDGNSRRKPTYSTRAKSRRGCVEKKKGPQYEAKVKGRQEIIWTAID